jgi:HPt (histidine-containing phosphotransfer) domain-containing protein
MDASKPTGRKTGPARSALRSEFAEDPEMKELVEYFVAELSPRMEAIDAALGSADSARLKTLAHQLKGAAGGFGFPTIGEAAAAVEREILAQEADLSVLRERVEDLLRICRSALPSDSVS